MNPQLSDAVRRLQTPETLAALGYVMMPVAICKDKPKRGTMTKTEARFLREVLAPDKEVSGILFNPAVLRLRNGHKYTPDFYCRRGDVHVMIEVKGGYKLGSYQRARLAYDQAMIEWPMFRWEWWELVDNEWRVK